MGDDNLLFLFFVFFLRIIIIAALFRNENKEVHIFFTCWVDFTVNSFIFPITRKTLVVSYNRFASLFLQDKTSRKVRSHDQAISKLSIYLEYLLKSCFRHYSTIFVYWYEVIIVNWKTKVSTKCKYIKKTVLDRTFMLLLFLPQQLNKF